MKSNIMKKAKGSPYPCLKQSNASDLLVLFTEKNCGTVLHVGKSAFLIGDYIQFLDGEEGKFTLFTGEVVLYN